MNKNQHKTGHSAKKESESPEGDVQQTDNRQLRDEYQTIAPYYEKILGNILYPLRKNVRTFIHFHNHKRVIDICCGTGKQLEILAEPDMELIGLDLSPAMMKESANSGNINFIQKDATEIDLPEQSFDAVLLNFALHEKSSFDRNVILQKSWDLVREEGHLIIADYCRHPYTFSGFIFGKILVPLLERLAGKKHYSHYRSWIMNGALDSHIQDLSDRKEIISSHFGGSVLLCAVFKISRSTKIFQSVNQITLG